MGNAVAVPIAATGRVIVCVNHRLGHGNPSCGGRGSEAIAQALERAGAPLGVSVVRLRCFGRCAEGPNVRIHGGRFFRGATVADVDAILAEARRTDAGGVDPAG